MPSSSKSPRNSSPIFSEPTYARLAVQLGEIVMSQAEATLAPVGLTPREYDALLCVSESPDMSQLELSKKLGLYAPRMVPLIDGLESRKLLERTVSSKDRRRNVIRLTEGGRVLLENANQLVAQLQQRLFGDITDRERKRFQKLVERLAALPCPDETHQGDLTRAFVHDLG